MLTTKIAQYFNCKESDIEFDENAFDILSCTVKVLDKWFDVFFTSYKVITLVLEAD